MRRSVAQRVASPVVDLDDPGGGQRRSHLRTGLEGARVEVQRGGQRVGRLRPVARADEVGERLLPVAPVLEVVSELLRVVREAVGFALPEPEIAALRNRESGTVLLRVHVDTSGNPYAVDLLKSSRSRSLDRAAAEAVKRWRFRPAMQGGRPVPGEVQVPITFNAER